MSEYQDLDQVKSAYQILEKIIDAERLDALKDMVVASGGRWDLPSAEPGVYDPVLMSIQVFGVHAMSASIEELPRNWMRAAANMLQAAGNLPEPEPDEQNAAPVSGTTGYRTSDETASGVSFPRYGSAQAPELGAEVRFCRSPSDEPETGIVRGRQFGTGIVEIVDMNAKPLRLYPEQYEVVTK